MNKNKKKNKPIALAAGADGKIAGANGKIGGAK